MTILYRTDKKFFYFGRSGPNHQIWRPPIFPAIQYVELGHTMHSVYGIVNQGATLVLSTHYRTTFDYVRVRVQRPSTFWLSSTWQMRLHWLWWCSFDHTVLLKWMYQLCAQIKTKNCFTMTKTHSQGKPGVQSVPFTYFGGLLHLGKGLLPLTWKLFATPC